MVRNFQNDFELSSISLPANSRLVMGQFYIGSFADPKMLVIFPPKTDEPESEQGDRSAGEQGEKTFVRISDGNDLEEEVWNEVIAGTYGFLLIGGLAYAMQWLAGK